MSRVSADDNQYLPPWLRGVPLPPRPSGMDAPLAQEPAAPWASAPAATSPAESDTVPDRLKDLSTATQEPAAPQPESPAKMAARTDAAAAAPPAGQVDTPAWLRDEHQEQPLPQPEDSDSGLPDWLRDIPNDEIRKVMEGDDEGITVEPFSFADASESPRAEPAADLPAWLASISEGADEQTDVGSSWLGGISAEPSEAANPRADAPAVPLWLQDLGGAPASPPTPETPPESAAPERARPAPEAERAAPLTPEPQDDLPAWLRDTEQAQPPADALPSWLQTEASAALPSEDLPAWLKERTGAEPSAPPPATPVEDGPAWLRADTAPPPSAPSSDAMPPPPAAEPPSRPQAPALLQPEGELPAWLRDETAAPPPALDQLPDWLQTSAPVEPPRTKPPRSEPPTELPPQDDELPPWLRDETGQPLPTAGAPGDTNLPEWLRDAPATATPAQPDWLRGEPPAPPVRPAPAHLDWFAEDEGQGVAGRATAGESEFFGGAELPAWLRKAETEPAAEISPADARSLDWLTKLGAHEEESAAAVAAPTTKLPPRPAPVRAQSQLEALALLQRLAAEPYPEPAALPAPAAPNIWQRIGLERLLYLVLLVVLLTALAVPSLAAGLQAPPEAPGAADLFQQINALTDKDVVLVGYEWDARRISEMKPLEQAVLGQLIQKHVKLVLVSTDPQGTLLLFDLRDQLEAANYRKGGEDYILLGYKPGGELALRSLAQDFQAALKSDFRRSDATISVLAGGLQTGRPLRTLNDFSMILVLADDASDVQGWVEQIHRSVPRKPLGFLLPAEAAPIVQPYLQPPRDPQQAPIAYLAGKSGALAYEQLRGAEHTPAVQVERETSQQRLGILVFVALLVIGGIAVAASGAMGRRKAA